MDIEFILGMAAVAFDGERPESATQGGERERASKVEF